MLRHLPLSVIAGVATCLAVAGCAAVESVPDVPDPVEQSASEAAPDISSLPGAGTQEATPENPGSLGEDRSEKASETKGLLEEIPPEPTPVSGKRQQPIETTQNVVYRLLRGTATRIDSFFGTAEGDTEATVSRGRLSVGGQYDSYNEFDGRVNLKARVRLPAFERRVRLIVGRGDADDTVAGVEDAQSPSLPSRFDDIDDDEWLFGIGYSRDEKLISGWSFGAGIKASTPVEPYVRATYRWNRGLGEAWLLRMRPRVYWQDGRGSGWSVSTTLDWSPYDKWLHRIYTIALDDDRTEGVRWTGKLLTYKKLSPKSAFSAGLFARGESDAEVSLQDYGVEFRHRRQISKHYLFVEFLTYLSWPRELRAERREITPGIGIEFELQFGEWPGRQPRTRPPEPGTAPDDETATGSVPGSRRGEVYRDSATMYSTALITSSSERSTRPPLGGM